MFHFVFKKAFKLTTTIKMLVEKKYLPYHFILLEYEKLWTLKLHEH